MKLISMATLKIGLALLTLSLLTVIAVYSIDRSFFHKNAVDTSYQQALHEIQYNESHFNEVLRDTADTLIAIEENSIFVNYLKNEGSKTALTDLLHGFARAHERIKQLQVIDQNGHEKIRITRNTRDSAPYLVESYKLSDLSERDYFIRARQDPYSMLHFSKLGSSRQNVQQNGEITATVRASLSSYDEDGFHGIVTVELFVQDLLKNLVTSPFLYNAILLDAQSYPICHYEKENNWGAYQNPPINLASEYQLTINQLAKVPVIEQNNQLAVRLNLPLEENLSLIVRIKPEYLQQLNKDHNRSYLVSSLVALALFILGAIIIFRLIKRQNRQLQQLNQQVLLASESARIGFWEFSLADRTFRFDKTLMNLWPFLKNKTLYSLDEIKLLPVPLAENLQQIDQEISNRALPFKGQFEIEIPWGKRHQNWRLQYKCMLDKTRQVICTGSCYEITDFKDYESQLLSQERRWKTALLGSGDSYWEWDIKTDRLYFSDRLCAILGYKENCHLPDMQQWLKLIHPEDLARSRKLLGELFQGQRNAYQNEIRVLDKNHQYRWLLDRGVVLNYDQSGKPEKMIGTHSDITERKTHELTAQRLTHEKQTLFNTIDSILITCDRDGIITHFNRTAELQLFYFSDKVVGKLSLLMLLNPIDFIRHAQKMHIDIPEKTLPLSFQSLYKIIEHQPVRAFTTQLRTRNNSTIPVMLSLFTKLDENREPNGLVLNATDLRPQKQLQERHDEFENKYYNLFEQSLDGILLIDAKTLKLMEFNQTSCKLLGFSPGELAELSLKDIDTEDATGSILKQIKKLEHRDVVSFESVLVDRSGQAKDVLIKIRKIHGQNRDLLYAILHDISDFKQIQNRLEEQSSRLIQAQSLGKLGSWTYNFISKKLNWSLEMFTIFEKNPLTFEPVFEDLTQDIHPDDRQRVLNTFLHAKEENSLFQVEYRVQMSDGRIKYVLERATFSSDENGETILAQGTVHDISETKQLQEELIQAKVSAENANRAKSFFLANMSHEIRTPLNGIIGINELLSKTLLNETQQEYLEKSTRTSKALMNIINDILDYSKIEAGKISFESTKFNLSELLSNLADLFSIEAEHKGIELIFLIDPEIPNQLIGDPLRISQVLNNLVGNALKFTSSGEIIISMRKLYSHNNQVEFETLVTDTGIGISPEHRHRLFKPFSQAESSNTRKYGGTGLGLIISKQLVEQMRGSIWLDEDYQKGSRFGFTLKLGFKKTSEDILQSTDSGAPFRVLALMSRHDEAENLKQTLNLAQMRTDLCTNLSECEQKAQQRTYNAVILELQGKSLQRIEEVLPLDSLHCPIYLLGKQGRQERLRKELKERKPPMTRLVLKPVIAHKMLEILLHPEEIRSDYEDSEHPLHFSGNVLLVEDNEINLFVATDFLKDLGLEVEQARNGQEAVEIASQKTFDLILMDLQMPVMDGFEAAVKIREFDSNTPIVALSAAVMEEDIDLCRESGINQHLSKPITLSKLESTLDEYLPRHGAENEKQERKNNLLNSEEKAPLINFTELQERYQKTEKIHYLLGEFLQSYQDFIANNQNSDSGSAAFDREIHTLKGVSSVVCLDRLFESTKGFYQAKTIEEKQTLRPELESVLQETLQAIRSYLQDTSP
ncbi:PAS domain S-box protein [Thiomicrorhabdus sp. 6S3-12]|uniref:PAS domain-containing hybrid sensor histidine kinase/response regulator n=1 Tax=Thiomicrorhabdus sp. 6S3-12 TaxID=2819681 RepID=UPI001AADDD3B|nr:PAS domain S-box protein [Thiomicrorhabdus sp. 6S3-12]MBO1923924.1 PAS domain S-box protein [Thiomicrorhabdus sp. 6S3-12]